MAADRPAAPIATIAAAIRAERARSGLSLAELARRAGIAKSTLSQLEAGTGNPSIETLWALGVALDVPFGRLVEPPRPAVRVVRAGEAPTLASEQAAYTAALLGTSSAGARADVYAITAEPGGRRVSEPHHPGVVEHVVLTAGRALVGPTGDPVELAPGDYVAYPGDAPHVFEALEAGTAAVMLSEHR